MNKGKKSNSKFAFDIKQSLHSINLLFFMILLAVFAIILLLYIGTGAFSLSEFYKEIINALIGIFIPLVIFNIFYEHLTKSHHNQELMFNITDAIVFNKDLIDRFSVETRKEFISNSIKSIIGDNRGDMLYNTLIKKYLDNEYKFRRLFKYYISINENDYHSKFENIEFKNDEYVWVEQDLSFYRTIGRDELVDETYMLAGFTFHEAILETMYSRASFFFRENLSLKEEHIDEIIQYDNLKLTQFVKEMLGFRFELNDKELKYVVENDINKEGFIVKIEVPTTINLNTESKLRFEFKMPQQRVKRSFIVSITEPTNGVDILFYNLQKDIKVVPIPFFDNGDVIKKLPSEMYNIELDDWVLPRAGVVFIWHESKNRNENNKITENEPFVTVGH